MFKRMALFYPIILFLLLIQITPTLAGTNLVTFQVNMGVQKELGRFNPATDKVVVRGDFNSWSGNADELLASETANVYKLTKEFSDADIGTQFGYKFAMIQNDGEVLETIANRTFTLLVGGQVLDVVFFNDRATVTTTANITFQADASELLRQGWFHPATDQILVSGSFNDWQNDAAYALTVDAHDSTLYSGTLEIADTVNTKISWKFRASPSGHFLDDGWEYGSNHIFTFTGENTVLEKTRPNIFPPAVPLAQSVTVRFSVNCNDVYDWYNKTKFPTVDRVYLNGDFAPLGSGNWAGWSVADTAKGAMIKMFDDGLTGGDLVADDNVWSVEVTFPTDSPSVHLYKYSIYSAGYSDTLNAGINPMDNEADSTRYHVLIIDDSQPAFANALDYFGSQWRKVQKNENPVTFQVDMSIQQQLGTFDPTVDKIVVRGDFNKWSGNSDNLLPDENTGVFTLTRNFPDSSIGTNFEYRFVIVSPLADLWENIPNRHFTLPAGGEELNVVYFDNRETLELTANVTFQADMSDLLTNAWFNPSADQMRVSGAFNSWSYDETYALQADSMDTTLYAGTFAYSGVENTEIKWRFRAFPEDHFLDNGWENSTDRVFTFMAKDTVLEKIKPKVLPADKFLSRAVTVRFSVNVNGALDWFNKKQFPSIDGVYLNGDFIPLDTGNWAGWTVTDTTFGSLVKMYDDGVNGGDETAGDQIFTVEVQFPAASPINHAYKYGIYSVGYTDTLNAGNNPMNNEAGFSQSHVLLISEASSIFVNETDYFGSQWWETNAQRAAGDALPSKFGLYQNYPNPFNPTTEIAYDLAESGRVFLTIFNALGQKVATLVDKNQQPGSYIVRWNGLSDDGEHMMSGVYFYSLTTKGFSRTQKMLLMK